MTGTELAAMVICYPDIEVRAFDPDTGDCQPVSAIEFNAAAGTVELQTFKRRKVRHEAETETVRQGLLRQ